MKKEIFNNLTMIVSLMFVLYNTALTFALYFGQVTNIMGVGVWFVLLIPTLIMWYITALNNVVTVRGGRSFFEE